MAAELTSPPNPESDQAVIVFDVDDVLRILADRDMPDHYVSQPNYPMFAYNPELQGWLGGLFDKADAYYISDWRGNSHDQIGRLLMMPELDWINDDPFRPHAREFSSRALAITAFFGGRPVAWLDDEINESDQRWAEQREAPTLLIKPNQDIGLQLEHMASVNSWLESLESR